MSADTVQCVTERNRIAFRIRTGFSLERGACSMRTSRGVSRPDSVAASKAGVKHQLHVRRLSPCAVEFWQSIHNQQSRMLNIHEIRMFDGTLKLEGTGWRAVHHEFYKCDRYFGGYSVSTGGLFRAIPGVEGEVGLSEDWPFPGIFFTHPERGTILMATLSQDRCKPCWTLRHRGQTTAIRASERFIGVPAVHLAGGGELTTERWVVLFTKGGLDDAVEQYYRFLRKRISFHGEKSIVRRAVLWGTWNYNYRPRSFCDITHDMVAANARALAKLVPDKPHFVMIDDGYQQRRSQEKNMQTWFSSCLEIFHDDGTPPHDPRLFPKGMKGIADAIRKAGSRPALWATIRLHKESPLAKARPEWLLKTDSENGFGVRSAYLDYSLPEVREFTRNAWRTIFQEWGFQGLKLDFWSMPFEVPQVRYRNQDRTAVELRNQFLQDVREFVPNDGFVLVAVVVNAGGNPFVGRYVDAVRMGMDIGDGSLPEVRYSAGCLTVASPFYRHDCLLGDPDSFGWCPKNTPGQNRLWATMTLLSGAVCEIGGDLTRPTAEARHLLQAGVRFFKPARRTFNGLADGMINNLPANHLVIEREEDVCEGYLNWSTLPWEITLPHPVRDIWSGEQISGTHRIPPQDAIMFKR